jgi:hypothetical protein
MRVNSPNSSGLLGRGRLLGIRAWRQRGKSLGQKLQGRSACHINSVRTQDWLEKNNEQKLGLRVFGLLILKNGRGGGLGSCQTDLIDIFLENQA